ncbi:MAG: VWA domain-containing protein [Akkermansiaceae bacterium]|nr:VWA domain-containing protein [Verrucomicrobiales bacterium]
MTFSHPHFAEPQWLWLAVFAPLLLIGLQRYATWQRRRQLSAIASPELIENLTRSHSRTRRAIKNTMLVLATAGMGIALARPQWGTQDFATQELGEDLVFAIDCSRSMLAADVSPNRLERAKLAVTEFVRRQGQRRVGLVAFSGQAFLQCPLTFDYDAFEESLRALDDKIISLPGTDIGRALDESFQAMEKKDRRKVLVLLTDGEDLEQSGVRTAEALARQGVVVFTIGIGTQSGTEIRIVNEQNQPELVRDSKGEPVRSQLDETTLKAIAAATKGSYFPLGGLGEGLTKVRMALEATDSTGVPVRKLGVDRFHIFVAIVLVWLVMESLIGTRRRTERRMP